METPLERITARVAARRAAAPTMDQPPDVQAQLDDLNAAVDDLSGRVAALEQAGVEDAISMMGMPG